MDFFDEEILNLWKFLQENQVRYILVGGFAVNLNGFTRLTADLDLWLDDNLENRKKFRKVLQQMELGDYEEIETTQLIPGWSSILLNSGFELDVMTYMKSFPSERFKECYNLASEVSIGGIQVKYLHINHLIETKRETARPKDLIDLVELEKIKNENK